MTESTAEAAGRVNLIGEHTDYHQGFVLPTAIPQRTRVHVIRRDDARVRVSSRERRGEVAEYTIGAEQPTQTWIDYIQGVTHALRSSAPSLPGFDLSIESDVPVGSGLSSSAALTVGLLRALRQLHGLPFDDLELARLAQRAETDFVGAPVGIMDPIACSLARSGAALFLDTRSLACRHVPIPATVDLVVVDSGIKHSNATGGYGERQRESFEAAEQLGVYRLRDIGVGQLDRIEQLPGPLARRARHVVTENQRVCDAVAALTTGDVGRVGRLLNASHASLRDDFEVSTPDLDRLVTAGQEDRDVFGARMTGGGFGGAMVVLTRAGMAATVADRILERYHSGGTPRGSVLLPLRAQPAELLQNAEGPLKG